MRKLGIAVVGLGRLGYVHAFNLARNITRARLVAVCDLNKEQAAAVAEELGCAAYTDLEEMLAQPAIDAVCVVTPTSHHVEPITAVVRAGKPLFCEKPLGASLEENVRLARLIREAGILFQIGFDRRFDPAYARAKRLIEEGAIGRPVYINCFARDPFPASPWACDPARGGGLFIDMLVHDFDICRYLMNDEVASLFAEEANLVVENQGIDRFADNVTVSLRFASGALGHCHASMHAAYGYDVRTEVFGEKGNLQIGGLVQTELTLATTEMGISRPITFLPEGKMPHFMIRFKEAFVREMEAFVDCVLEDRPPAANEKDALAAFKIAAGAISSAGRKSPITLED